MRLSIATEQASHDCRGLSHSHIKGGLHIPAVSYWI
jgi:hypothetical protein